MIPVTDRERTAAVRSEIAVIQALNVTSSPFRLRCRTADGTGGKSQAPRAMKECAVASASGSSLVALRAASSASGSVAPR